VALTKFTFLNEDLGATELQVARPWITLGSMSTEADETYRPLVAYPTQMSLHHVAAKALLGNHRSRKERLADRQRQKPTEQTEPKQD